MTHTRKNFNYLLATVSEIAQHFKSSSRQAIYAVQVSYNGDEEMTAKIKEALLQYKIARLHENLY